MKQVLTKKEFKSKGKKAAFRFLITILAIVLISLSFNFVSPYLAFFIALLTVGYWGNLIIEAIGDTFEPKD